MEHQLAPRVCVFAGTRPEFIKLAPIIRTLRWWPPTKRWQVQLIATGQHPDLTDDLCRELGLSPDVTLPDIKNTRNLTHMAGRLLCAMARHMPAANGETANFVIVQGDTTSALAGAIAGHYSGCTVVHVEAGLRSGDASEPFPEETNRRVIADLASLHFAPTDQAVSNLLTEGVDPASIACVGNTIIDAVQLYHCGQPRAWPRPYVLATCHRRENWRQGLSAVCDALSAFAGQAHDYDVLFALHPNPALRNTVVSRLGGTNRIHLLDPQPYGRFLGLLKHAAAVITDSGGLQEEASEFGVPVVLCRRKTERPELMVQGGILAGTQADGILSAIEAALAMPRPAAHCSPFGDGRAADRIVTALARYAAGKRPLLTSTELFVANRQFDAEVPLNNRKASAIGTGLW